MEVAGKVLWETFGIFLFSRKHYLGPSDHGSLASKFEAEYFIFGVQQIFNLRFDHWHGSMFNVKHADVLLSTYFDSEPAGK